MSTPDDTKRGDQMGEYARYRGASIKIGTCEAMADRILAGYSIGKEAAVSVD